MTTMERRALVLLVTLLVTLVTVTPSAAEAINDLDTLEDVRGALDHAQDAVEDLQLLLNNASFTNVTTLQPPSTSTPSTNTPSQSTHTTTTIQTTTSTSAPATTTIQTTTSTSAPATTTIQTTTSTSAPATTTIQTTTSTSAPATTTIQTTTPTTATTIKTTTTTTPVPTTASEPTDTSTDANTLPPVNPTHHNGMSPIRGLLRVHEWGYTAFRQGLVDNVGIEGPRGAVAGEYLPPLGLLSSKQRIGEVEARNDEQEKEDYDENTSNGTTTTSQTTTELLPWSCRVNDCLDQMLQLIGEIEAGAADESHANQLDRESAVMDSLVEEGEGDPVMVQDSLNDVDYDLLDCVVDTLDNTTAYIDTEIEEAKGDRAETIAVVTCMTVLFVGVTVAVLFALIRPASQKSGLSDANISVKAEGREVAEDESKAFSNAKYVQHSHLYYDPYKSHTTTV